MEFKPLDKYTNEELVSVLEENQIMNLLELAGYLSEILRRMNKIKPLLGEGEDETN